LAGRARLGLLYAGLVALLWAARPTAASVIAGFALVAIGEGIRVWAAGHLVKTRRLIVAGPYRYTRNPLYLGRLLIFTGLCVAATLPYLVNYAVLLGGWAVFFVYYLPRKERVEPARLRAVHGERYERYRRSVPALFPTVPAYDEQVGDGWSVERMLRNREHWMLIGLLALGAWMVARLY
jgi:protein-S-isoprenylcysteine O-methyltransferase Ste14